MFILHHWPLDPWSRQARLALAEKKCVVELRFQRFWDPEDHFFDLNPAGLTPVLEDRSGETPLVIVQADAILAHLEETRPEPPLLPADPAGRAEVRRLVSWFDRKFDAEVNAYLLHEKLEKRMQNLGSPDAGMIRAGRDYLRAHLDYMSMLLERRDGLAGPRYSMADLVAAAHLSCVDYLGDVPWDSFPAAKAWYERIKCRPAFRSLLDDRLPGLPPARWYADLDF